MGYGFFIPIFFVYSGMTLDIDAIIANPAPMLVVFVVIFVVRGLPALFWYRNDLPRNERLQMVFLTATTLPLLVALTSIGVANGTMTTSAQASAIGAGVLTVLVFPIVAVRLRQRQSAANGPNPRINPPSHRSKLATSDERAPNRP